jgi:threonine synthase
MPNVVALQSERCAPIAEALGAGLQEPATVSPIPTMAEGIAIGKPMRGPEILEKIYKYGMKVVKIPEDRILEARAVLAKKGIYCEHTTAANLAGYWEYCRLYGKTPDSLVTMCGAGLKSDH